MALAICASMCARPAKTPDRRVLLLALLRTMPMTWKATSALSTVLLFGSMSALSGSGRDPNKQDLSYKDRGNLRVGQWSEGTGYQPIGSPPDISLLSVVVDYQEEVTTTPASFKLRFYLGTMERVFLIVRELDDKNHYWLDNVRPNPPWRIGENDFQWSPAEVINSLKNDAGQSLSMYDFGVVARLDSSDPAKEEKVAPVVFYHTRLPRRVTGYKFYVKTRGDAKWTYSVYNQQGQAMKGSSGTNLRVPGLLAFPIRWNPSGAADGWYKLVLTGSFVGDNSEFTQKVDFYHKTTLGR